MAARYAWKITQDHLFNEDTPSGPRNADPTLLASVKDGAQFTMYDDDRELYYTGFIVGDYTGFEPLDDFGTPNAGCTEIRIDGVSQ